MARANPTLRTITVQTGGKNPEAPGYTDQPNLVCKGISYRLDAQPSTAIVEYRVPSNQQGPGYTVTDLMGSSDTYGSWRVASFEFEDHLRVQIDGTTVFTGQITDYSLSYSDSGVVATLVAQDARSMLRKMPMYGRWTSGFGAFGFLYGAYTVFNEGGKRTLREASKADIAGRNEFDAPDATSSNPAINSVHWTLLDILEYVRAVMDSANGGSYQDDLGTWNPYIKWPAPRGDDDSPPSLGNDLGGDDDVIPNFNIHGMGLPEILNAILTRSGRYHWALIQEDDTKPTLKIIKDFDGEFNINLDLGNTGTKIQNLEPTSSNVLASSLNINRSWRNFYNSSIVHGGPRRIELTVSTLAIDDNEPPMLERDWTDEEQDSFLDAWVDPDDDKKWTDTHARVFLQWRIKDGLDWARYFDITDTTEEWAQKDQFIALGYPRPQMQYLLDADNAYRYRDGTPPSISPKRKVLIQRSTDSGATWESIPSDWQISLLGERGGFRLQRIAREIVKRGGGDSIGAWTWSAASIADRPDVTVYDMRITCVFEHDGRIWANVAADTLSNQNIKRKALRADNNNVYESITRAATRVFVGNEEEIQETAFSIGQHVPVRNDTQKLQSAGQKLIDQLDALPTSGTAEVQGTDPEHRKCIGSRITGVTGNPQGLANTNWGIVEVQYTFDPEQKTTFKFGLQ